jgi:hypothetical protein
MSFITRAFEIPPIRWLIEAASLFGFELYGVPHFKQELPDAGVIFGVLISAIFVISEISSYQMKAFRSEGDSIRRRVTELISTGALGRLEQQITNVDNQIKLIGSIVLKDAGANSAKGSQYFNQYYEDTVKRLTEIIDGRFTLITESPEQIWKSHIYSLEHATPKIAFFATCLVPKTQDGTRAVFENETFIEYCHNSYQKLKDGRLSELRKIFIAEDARALEHLCFRGHLQEIQKLSEEIGEERLQPRIIILGEVKYSDLSHIPEDFMLWGDELVVTSRMGELHLLHGLEASTHENDILRMTTEFQRLYRLARPVKEVLNRRTK